MWPRTQEEVLRNRVSGFVCYRYRRDAENAMEACDDTDLFRNGRRLMIRWGKNVLKEQSSFGYGTEDSILKKQKFRQENIEMIDLENAVKVLIPKDSERERFITNVASLVAMDGPSTESRILEERRNDEEYSFLAQTYHEDETTREEHQFYRWRVYSFRKGEARYNWRTEPFQMVPDARAWIPPKRHDESLRSDRDRRAVDGNQKLSASELEEFQNFTRHKLCTSRKAICAAMAFCFEHSGCSTQIGKMLRDLLLDKQCSVEIRVSRIYLLSDILFNSQQPGVKNAFRYRDAIEKMAPSVFNDLGQHDKTMGRMRRQKLQVAVHSVLSAWTNWSVFDTSFLSELEARFEGREIIKKEKTKQVENVEEKFDVAGNNEIERKDAVTFEAHGDWTEVGEGGEDLIRSLAFEDSKNRKEKPNTIQPEFENDDDDDDIDGLPLNDDDLDKEGLRRLHLVHQITGDSSSKKQTVMGEEDIALK